MTAGGEGIETVSRGRDTLYYKAATNEFGVKSQEGVIRTYFKPVEGAKYLADQKVP